MQDLDDMMRRVFEHTLRMDTERLSWEKAPALTGMLRSGQADMVDGARGILERSIATQTSDGHLNYNEVQHYGAGHAATITSTTLTASLGLPLLLLHELQPDDKYLQAAQRQSDGARRTQRTADGGLASRLERLELWIDWVYMLCPFFAKLGQVTGDSTLTDEAYLQHRVHVDHLVDGRKHLGRHAWAEVPDSFSQSTFWSRGNGWLGAGTVELLDIAPDHESANDARGVLQRLAEAILPLQDASGFWRHVLDDPNERFETSGTLMHAYWLSRGVELGVLDERCLDASRSAFAVCKGCVGEDGAVTGVAVPPGGPGVPFGATAFGQGFFLQAAQVLRRLGND